MEYSLKLFIFEVLVYPFVKRTKYVFSSTFSTVVARVGLYCRKNVKLQLVALENYRTFDFTSTVVPNML
jgi:hypothetical protein